jgi:glucose-6-phosphate dehydrogenase assembly protein OpcA
MSGPLTKHPQSVVLPLLLPDSPVVVWWPGKAPDDPADDPLGRLAKRRITDTASIERGRAAAMLTQATNYSPGNTDLSWTRLTPWRALLAAALDQYPTKVKGGVVEAERVNPSADLLVAWLSDRLKVTVDRKNSKGPGITTVALETGGGPIEITRPDGLLAEFSIPNAPTRPVALKRRPLAELLAEELRRMDPDDVYAETVRSLCRLNDETSSHDRGLESARAKGQRQVGVHEAAATAKAGGAKKKTPATKTAAKKPAAKKAIGKRTAKKAAAKKKPVKKARS